MNNTDGNHTIKLQTSKRSTAYTAECGDCGFVAIGVGPTQQAAWEKASAKAILHNSKRHQASESSDPFKGL